MSKFKLTDDKIDFICTQFGITEEVDKKLVKRMGKDFLKFYDETVRTQYLANIVKAMERYVHEEFGVDDFKIVVRMMQQSKSKIGTGILIGKKRFVISIPENVDAASQRNIVAHELGHLFFMESNLSNKSKHGVVNDPKLKEKMADIIGIFTILERTDFYKEKAPNLCKNENWQQVVTDFQKLGIIRRGTQ
jgi:Zn-dependent peptidase ImmA (M78 family)